MDPEFFYATLVRQISVTFGKSPRVYPFPLVPHFLLFSEELFSAYRRPSEQRSQEKTPKKNHKAEREKLKRDQLNDLFLELSSMLG